MRHNPLGSVFVGLGPQMRRLAASACAVDPVFSCFSPSLPLDIVFAFVFFVLPVIIRTVAVRPHLVQLSPAYSNPPRRGLASVGVGVLGAPDPAPEAVTNYYVTRPPPPLEDSPSQNPPMQPLKMITMEF